MEQLRFLKDQVRVWARYWPWVALTLVVIFAAKLVQMDFVVREKFEGKRWRLPSTVYSRPLEFFEGAILREEDIETELQGLNYLKVESPQHPGEYSVKPGSFTIYRRPFVFWESREEAKLIHIELSGKKLSKLEQNGKPVRLARLEAMKIGGIYPTQKEDRKLVQLKQVPQSLIDSLIAIEDKDFYDHWGVSVKGISRALYSNVRAGRLVEGGSTLTQQLVKNFYLSSERSLRRKIIEALYSVLLELHYSKEEILETYINEIYLGQSGDSSIHGFGLASEFYFGRSIETLSLEQSALLAAMVNGPSLYNPLRYPDRSKKRRDRVLEILLEQQKIDEATFRKTAALPVVAQPSLLWMANRFPAYLDLVRRHLERDYAEKDLGEEGLRIFTAFDPTIQLQSEKAAADFMHDQGRQAAKLQLAAVVVTETGEVQAIVGNKIPGYQGFNRALDAKRSIGSLAKPAVLLSALSDSNKYSLGSPISDEPIHLQLGPGQYWEPKNFDSQNHGTVSLLAMLTHSYNQATVRLGTQVGIPKVRDTFIKLSGNKDIPSVPSITLGSMGMSPYEVAGMYYTIFSGGYRSDLKAVRGVQNRDGKALKSFASKVKRVFDPGVMHVLQFAMRAVVMEGTGRSAYTFLPGDMQAAGKTGTSNDQRDSWFAGFTGDKLAVAWVGSDSHIPTNLTGSSGGLSVWARIMGRVAQKSLSLTNAPVSYRWVDASGLLSAPECVGARFLPFVSGTVPSETGVCQQPLAQPSMPAPSTGKEENSPVVDWLYKLMQ